MSVQVLRKVQVSDDDYGTVLTVEHDPDCVGRDDEIEFRKDGEAFVTTSRDGARLFARLVLEMLDHLDAADQ